MAKTEIDVNALLLADAAAVEDELQTRLSPAYLGDENPMTNAMRYAVLGGGKRIRAFLVYEFCKMFGGRASDAAPYAAAIEMVHAYSLIHDDLPCMDNDDMRRGKPSCHKAFGEATALLAGDALLTYAFETAALSPKNGDRINRYAIYELSHGAGACGMCGGQEIDLELSCKSYAELKHLHNLKTGALIRTAALLGYYAAVDRPDQVIRDKISAYAMSLGLAFQIEDDLLDTTSTTEELGKPVGSDEKNGKKTVLSYMSEKEAADEAQRLSEYAAGIFRAMKNSDAVTALPLWLVGRRK